MSIPATTTIFTSVKADPERGHRWRLRTCYVLATSLVLGLGVYGFDYYLLDPAQRPFSPKHALLRPNGEIGLLLGVFASFIFLGIFLYPIRKRWGWLRIRGSTRHWLDFHVLMGLLAPCIVAFHSSLKFRGLAGVAFWIMTAVAISGVIGRYLYAQIPRSLNTAEFTLQEVRSEQAQLSEELARQNLFPASLLAPVFRLPSEERVRSQPLPLALAVMMFLDLARLFHSARLRRHALGFWGQMVTLGGILASGNAEAERVLAIARQQAGLSKRILFLSRTQQVFHLWHVIHRPFSYSFAVLALIHIAVVMVFGIR
ncbi:MAG: hypothetical protein LAP13_05915 [Acidobacteriia bacterium]|nr:hypothetical protein [Terriglobia bacterium]